MEAMNVNEYLASGMIENYCLGFTSPEENGCVRTMATQYPAIQQQIDVVKTSLETILMQPVLEPCPSIKKAVLNFVNAQQ